MRTTLRSLARVALVAAALCAASASAADLDALKDTTPAERAKAQTAMMKGKLGLTDAEVAKVGPINMKYAEKMEPIIKGDKLPLMKMKDMREVEGQKEAELKGILTADQFTKFEASKEEMMEKLADQIRADRAKK
jgi:Spy/CpxP family protein refolding chaperone